MTTRFAQKTDEEKSRLIERAHKLKPKYEHLIATNRGWEIDKPNGTRELLVSFVGLDKLLDSDEEEIELEPSTQTDSTSEIVKPKRGPKPKSK